MTPFPARRAAAACPCALLFALLLAPLAGAQTLGSTPATPASAATAPRPPDAPKPAPLMRLKAGNERFVKGAALPAPLTASAREAASRAETPFAMVLSCADARVPPEYIFNAGLGDLYVVRSAGQVVDKAVLGTLEHGVEHLHVPLLVVMGHESCAVVKAAMETPAPEGSSLQYLARAIRTGTDRTASERRELRDAILANVEQVINDALGGSAILRRAVSAGTLQVVGAYYELATGKVMFSEPVTVPPSSSSERH